MRGLAVAFAFLALLTIPALLFATTYYVNDTTGNDVYDGLAPAWDGTHGPKKTIQAGIDAAAAGDTVVVADGTYTGEGNRDLDFGGRGITLVSENGAENTIIDCEGTEIDPHRGFYFHSGETADTVLDGFTIQNGRMSGEDGGGGIHCINSGPTVTNCTILGNVGVFLGGGIYCRNGNPAITNCAFRNNSAEYHGGGLYCRESNPVIRDCTFIANSAMKDWKK